MSNLMPFLVQSQTSIKLYKSTIIFTDSTQKRQTKTNKLHVNLLEQQITSHSDSIQDRQFYILVK